MAQVFVVLVWRVTALAITGVEAFCEVHTSSELAYRVSRHYKGHGWDSRVDVVEVGKTLDVE